MRRAVGAAACLRAASLRARLRCAAPPEQQHTSTEQQLAAEPQLAPSEQQLALETPCCRSRALTSHGPSSKPLASDAPCCRPRSYARLACAAPLRCSRSAQTSTWKIASSPEHTERMDHFFISKVACGSHFVLLSQIKLPNKGIGDRDM
jgi:hypothetical protein